MRLMKREKLSWSEAATKAYQQAKKDGVYGGLKSFKGVGGKGSSAADPLPQPADPTKLVNNQWYMLGGVPQLVLNGKAYTQAELDEMDNEDKVLNEQ